MLQYNLPVQLVLATAVCVFVLRLRLMMHWFHLFLWMHWQLRKARIPFATSDTLSRSAAIQDLCYRVSSLPIAGQRTTSRSYHI